MHLEDDHDPAPDELDEEQRLTGTRTPFLVPKTPPTGDRQHWRRLSKCDTSLHIEQVVLLSIVGLRLTRLMLKLMVSQTLSLSIRKASCAFALQFAQAKPWP